MTDDDFILDVVSHPFDPSFRDVYADWLEDQGDGRAEFLRLQSKFREVEPFSKEYDILVKEEKKAKFGKKLKRPWWEKMRQFTTPPPPVDITEKVPEIKSYRRSVIRLHPQFAGHGVDPRFSKIGGQFLWPADEPWPKCPRGLPMVPIFQLRSWDFPELKMPKGCDVLQLFWSAHNDDAELNQPIPYLKCRRAADVIGPLAKAPDLEKAMDQLDMDFSEDELRWARDENIPYHCAVYPERIEEYPGVDEMFSLRQEVVEHYEGELQKNYSRSYPDYHSHLARCPGWVLGCCKGLSRNEEQRPWQALGTFTYGEYQLDHDSQRWQPLEIREHRHPGFGSRDPESATGLGFGDSQDLVLWVCFDGEMPNVEMYVCEL